MFCLSPDDIEQIDRTSLRILSELGVRVDDAKLREQALAAGAKKGRDNETIRLPSKMVREYVAMAPVSARFADCCGRVDTLAVGSRPTFWTGAALNYIVGRQCRPIGITDLVEFTRIADSLDTVFAVVGTSIEEVRPQACDFVGFRIMAENTGKHLRPVLYSSAGVKPIIEMAEIIADGRTLAECPLVSFGYSCLSPLHWSQIAIDLWRNSAGHKLPIMLNGEPIAGATSPVTLSASIALSNAEILAGIVLVQLLEPGRPVVHNLGFAHVMEMRTAMCLSGSAECALMAYAGAKLAAYYNLPCASWMDTDSFTEDQQASAEKVLTGFAHVLGSVNMIWGMGQLESTKALSPVQLVIDDEIVRGLLRFRDGFGIDEENLAFDVICDVVTKGGDFLSHKHTLAHFRDELSESALMARSSRESWQAAGSTTLGQRAGAYVKKILQQEPSAHLTDMQRRDILAIEKRHLKAD
jgi:trimethylamine--corrinoid protein Co-methyltransferase